MGFLSLAGVISGAGKAGQQAFSDMSRFAAADMMEQRRQQFDLEKQQRMLETQREMNRETLAATSKEKGLDRTQQTNVVDKNLKQEKELTLYKESATDSRLAGERILKRDLAEAELMSHKEIVKLNNETHKEIASGNRASQEKIAKINTEAQKSIHYSDRLMKKYEIETTAENSTKMATSRALTEIGNETTRLTALLANPMLEPETAKELQARLRKLEGIHDAYSRSMLPEGEKGAAASTPRKPLPPFQFPKNIPPPRSGGGYPGSFKAPGVKVLPMPGEQEQEMMGRALQP